MRLIDADKIPYVQDAAYVKDYDYAYRYAIEAEPTVDVQPVRHGVWKKIRGTINCSECKSCSWSMSFEDLVTSFNFCPNCGAKMDGEEKEKAFWPRYLLKPCASE